jgi:hypothetical protein
MENKQTAVEWLYDRFLFAGYAVPAQWKEQAKAMEKEQRGYTEEQAYQFWKAGQEYWKTSGSSITFEELIEKYHNQTYGK